MKATALVSLGLVALAISCSSSFASQPCSADAECSAGHVCSLSASGSFCTTPEKAPLRIGMSAPASGPSQELGIEMRKGINLAFEEQNEKGGIRGRSLILEFRDDSYVPELAEASTRELLDVKPEPGAKPRCPTTSAPVVAGQAPVADSALERGPRGVLALIGNVGTPTMVRSAPIAVEAGALFFGAFTGADKFLRDGLPGPCSKYVFNVRASYGQEARATVEYFTRLGVPDYKHLVSFDQSDAFGQAGYDGLTAAYTAVKGPLPTPDAIKRVRYTRDDPGSVPPQAQETAKYLASLLAADSANHVVGIMMTDTYGAAVKYITALRDWQFANDEEQVATKKASRLTLYFSNVSFVGPDALAARLKSAGSYNTPSGPKSYATGVFVSQVVPNLNDASDGVQSYMKLIEKSADAPTFTSLEGYLAARVFIAGLLESKDPEYKPESLIDAFERLPKLNLGFGASAGFSTTSHGYSKSVWGTAITPEGTFDNLYYWSEGSPLQVYE